MEMLDRYLNAVGFWLPRRQKQDILAELAEDLRAQIADKEAEVHHSLNEDDLATILRKCGSPLVVASRYLPQRSVVTPLLFPIYKFLLKLVLFGYLVPWLAVWLSFVAFSPAYRTAHPGVALIHTLDPLWVIAINTFAMLTIGFWIIDRLGFAEKLTNWDPRKLPSLGDSMRVKMSSAIADAVWNVIFLLWWLGYPHTFSISYALERAGIHGSWGSVWKDFIGNFYWPVAAATAVLIAVSIVNLRRPYWTREKLGARLGANAALAGMLGYVLVSHLAEVRSQIAMLSAHAVLPGNEAATMGINICVYFVLVSVAVGCLGMCAYTLYQMTQWKPSTIIADSATRSGGAFVLFG